MKKKNSKIYFWSAVIGITYGLLYCLTGFGIIVGGPLISVSTQFIRLNQLTDYELSIHKKSIAAWSIVVALFAFPFGFIALIPILKEYGREAITNSQPAHSTPKLIEDQNETVKKVNDKLEKIKQIHNLKQTGTIEEEEFKLVKEQIVNE